MSKSFRLFVLLPAIILSLVKPAMSADYLGTIKQAVSSIELGEYDRAAAEAEHAQALNEYDPLVHTTFAVIYLHTGRLDESTREFKEAIHLQPDDWRAMYGLALVARIKGDLAESQRWLSEAATEPGSEADVASLNLYLKYTTGQACTKLMFDKAVAPLGMETAAIQTYESERKVNAESMLTDIVDSPALLGFQENRAPLATFDPKLPLLMPKGKLTWKPSKRAKVPVVTGRISLNADTSRSDGVSFVSFYVDDQFAATTNYEPYRFDWDTIKYSNGVHQIRIDGKNAAGSVVSSKTIWARVDNPEAELKLQLSGPEVDKIVDDLWNCTRVNESRALAHYLLARSYLASGQKEKAFEHLEYTVAYQSDFKDAASLLHNLRSEINQNIGAEIAQGPRSSKEIAFTFDDGPNERTQYLLALLAKLHISATFFVVGFRAEEQPELIRAMVAGGHEVENHSYTHTRFNTLNTPQIEEELSKTSAIIRAITGKPSIYFRPPGGHAGPQTIRAAEKLGLTGIFWTALCSPYEGARSPELAGYVIRSASNGGIVLMHNGEPGEMSALPEIVSALRAKGFKFVTISELLADGHRR
jgi:peptidoglycan/xylan/chitin deacetylase (PgdA/CDA1 family)